MTRTLTIPGGNTITTDDEARTLSQWAITLAATVRDLEKPPRGHLWVKTYKGLNASYSSGLAALLDLAKRRNKLYTLERVETPDGRHTWTFAPKG